jgi:hypothetical protein
MEKRRRQRQQQQQSSSDNKTNDHNNVHDDDEDDDDEYNPCRNDYYSVISAANHLSHSNRSKLITTLLEIFDAFRINKDTNQPMSSKARAWRRKMRGGILEVDQSQYW